MPDADTPADEGTAGEPALEPERAASDVILAIDIGATKVAAGLMTMRGELLDRSRAETERDVGPQSHFANLVAIVQEQLDRAERHHRVAVRAIGSASAGPIERNCDTV